LGFPKLHMSPVIRNGGEGTPAVGMAWPAYMAVAIPRHQHKQGRYQCLNLPEVTIAHTGESDLSS